MNLVGKFYTGNTNFSIKFTNKPLPQNMNMTLVTDPYFSSQIFYFFTAVFLLVSTGITTDLCQRFDSGFYFLMMTKSGERNIYFICALLVNLIVHLILTFIFVGCLKLISLKVENIWLNSVLFSIVNPFWILSIVGFFSLSKR